MLKLKIKKIILIYFQVKTFWKTIATTTSITL
jgi:hypothetical protein